MNEKSEGFNDNYETLKQISDDLSRQSQGEPDIDGLIPKVERATAAYKACKARLDAVEKVLKEQLPGVEVEEVLGGSEKDEYN